MALSEMKSSEVRGLKVVFNVTTIHSLILHELKGFSSGGQNTLQCIYLDIKFRKFSGATLSVVGVSYSAPPQTHSTTPTVKPLSLYMTKMCSFHY